MTVHEASRTLVKSPPELWAECSDAASLARHLGQFGEIRITRLEPETAVAWEGANASGTVRLEPSGWGTRVILTARESAEEDEEERKEGEGEEQEGEDREGKEREGEEPSQAGAVDDPRASVADPHPDSPPPSGAPRPAPKPWVFGRWLGFLRRVPPPAGVPPPPHGPPESAPAAAPPAAAPRAALESNVALVSALDSLGQAHHRPFSRP